MKVKLYRIAICLMFAVVTTVAQTSPEPEQNSRSTARGWTSSIVKSSTLQSEANFNVEGRGEAATINARSHIEIAGDRFLKISQTNVEPYKRGIDVIDRLKPVSFNWKDGNIADVGLVAEEVEKVDPLLVTYNKGQLEGVKYDRIGVVLINVVKEQQARIEAQKKQNADLQDQIDKLKALVETYKIQGEELRMLIFCRTSMRPELCAQPEE